MMVNCKQCGSHFYVKPSHWKMGEGVYCSRKCTDRGRKTGKYVFCRSCRKKFYARRKQLRLSKSKQYFCSRACYFKYKAVHLVREGHPMWKYGEAAYHKLMLEERKPICQRCGISWLKVLVVHHIDENRKNNVLSNLVWLCRNCHFLAHRYRERIDMVPMV